MARTFQDQLTTTDGRPSGFEYLRITLAVAVVVWHEVMVLQGHGAETAVWTGPLRPFAFFILPSFFTLSGFLVAGSLERNDLPSFLTLRALRIFPALGVEVVLSALVLGPLLTTFALSEYFTDGDFYRYFLNVIGYIHYDLPGLFLQNPGTSRVNLQLWTVPYELECYLMISVVALLTLHRRPRALAAALIVLLLARTFLGELAGLTVEFDHAPPGRMLVLCFLFGVSFYTLRDRTPFNVWLGLAAAAAAVAALTTAYTTYLATLPIAYLTIYLGLLNPRRNFIVRGADYSYGVYLYGFPVQQVVVMALPLAARVWWIHLPISLAATTLFALMSWHLVEKRILDQKKPALAWVQKATAWAPRWATLRQAAPTRG